MGYHTDFAGSFELNKKLDDETYEFLIKFNKTRRMARNVDPKYGVEGEFYVDGGGEYGQGHEDNIIDYNKPPSTQPGLWCQWRPSDDREYIEWDGGDKFYYYVEWIEYLIEKILAPKGYILNGTVRWNGEEWDDRGNIVIVNNKVAVEDEAEYSDILNSVLRTKGVLPTLLGIHPQLDTMIHFRLGDAKKE